MGGKLARASWQKHRDGAPAQARDHRARRTLLMCFRCFREVQGGSSGFVPATYRHREGIARNYLRTILHAHLTVRLVSRRRRAAVTISAWVPSAPPARSPT